MELELSTFGKTFEYLTQDLGIKAVSAAFALAQANRNGTATWYESDFPVRELHRVTNLVSGPYRVVL